MDSTSATSKDDKGESLAPLDPVAAPPEAKKLCCSLKIDIRMSGLPSKVVAKEVFGFLDRQTILSCFKVEELCKHLHLQDHYCTDHGSTLESQVERRKELDEVVGPRKNHEPGVEERVECADCVEAEYGYVCCPHCDLFASLDEMEKCDECGKQFCDTCREAMDSFGQCEMCLQRYCGEQGCTKVVICEGCDKAYCGDCCTFDTCCRCDKHHGCDRCCVNALYRCCICRNSFCFGCKEQFHCSLCHECYCTDCFDAIYCSSCDEPHCGYCAGQPCDAKKSPKKRRRESA